MREAEGARGRVLPVRAAALAVAAGLLLMAAEAGAAPKTYVANKAADHQPGKCTKADCTLREAVIAANHHAGRDKVVLLAKTYTLAIEGTNENASQDGDLDLFGPVTIAGRGAAKSVIDGGGEAVHDHAIEIFPAGPGKRAAAFTGATIEGVTIRNSSGEFDEAGVIVGVDAKLRMSASRIVANVGGGCCNGLSGYGGSSLRLTRVVVAGNEGQECCNGVIAEGSLTATRTRIKGNSAPDCCNGLLAGPGSLRLSHVTIANNDSSKSCCNGLELSNGDAVITDSKVIGNDGADDDSGCCNGIEMDDGKLTLKRVIVADNTGQAYNGILGAAGRASFDRIVVSGNSGFDCCQGIIGGDAPMLIKNSTVSGNVDASQCCAGIDGEGSPITLRNVTVSGNAAAGCCAGVFDQDLTLNNVTIAANTADTDASGGEIGAGISPGAGFFMQNSIVAGNALAATPSDCSGAFESGGHNLIEVTTGCTITGVTSGNILGADPRLGPLADNGGFAETHALRRGSPAINKGSPLRPGSGGRACERRDERGHKRTDCDIGAFER